MSANQTTDVESTTTYAENAAEMREADDNPREHGFTQSSELVERLKAKSRSETDESPDGNGRLGRCDGCNEQNMLYPEYDYECISCYDGDGQ